MLHVVLATFIILIIICGIEGMQNGGLPLKTYARINDTFELGCYVSQSGGKLDFYDDNDLVPESFLKRINDSYVVYRNSCSRPTRKNITCKRRDEKRNRVDNVGMSEIYVDGEISPVNGFKCRTADFHNLTCSFKQPTSVFSNDYHLSYTKNNAKKPKKCRLELDFLGGRSCQINITKDNVKSVFSFTLYAKNHYYEKVEKHEVQILESLVPQKLENVFVRHLKPQIISIVLRLPEKLKKAARDLLFDVRLKAKEESDSEWKGLSYTQYEENDGEVVLPLNKLEYANTVYQYKVRVKSKTSQDIEEMWSPYLLKTFKTKPKLPEMTVKVCKNCFNVMDNGNIFLHWMEIPKFYQNGDNFSYFVRMMNDDGKIIHEEHLEKAVLMIPKDVNTSSLTVHIYSSNDVGLSHQYSVAHVPFREKENLLNIKKELIDDTGYKLSWKLEAIDAIDVASYTVLFCRQRNELQNQCDGSIRYLQLSANEFEFTFNASNSYQFGIAANRYDGQQTGFQWALCTASKPNEIGIVRSMWSQYVSESSISLEWKLNCADKDIIYGYNISYCIVADYDSSLCIESPTYEIFYDNHSSRKVYQILSLKPYKQYNISIALISLSERSGAFSAPITIRTLEASPTAPRNLQALNISDNSISLLWQRPREINGPSLTYQLWCNDKMIQIDNNQTLNESYQFTIEGLKAYSNYTITVVACTRNCSRPSGSLHLRTKIGRPGKMNQILLRSFDNGTIYLKWEEPSFLGGLLDYYLLNITYDNYDSKFFRINGRRKDCVISAFTCDNYVYFSMLSVNIDLSEENDGDLNEIFTPSSDTNDCLSTVHEQHKGLNHYYGSLSEPASYMCQFNYGSIINIISRSSVAMIITVVFLMSVLALIAYVLLKIYHKIQEMKDIHIVWPQGIESSSPEKPERYNPNSIYNSNDCEALSKLNLIVNHSMSGINNNSNIICNLSDIKEESCRDLEFYNSAIEFEQNYCKEIKEDSRQPIVKKSKTCEVIFNGSTGDYKRSQSVPSSPHNDADHSVDQRTGYMKMYSPIRSNNSINNVGAAGYCDMSGRTSNSNVNHISEIKSFLRDSDQNNGYIKRKSVIKTTFPIGPNGNGYIGLKKVNN